MQFCEVRDKRSQESSLHLQVLMQKEGNPVLWNCGYGACRDLVAYLGRYVCVLKVTAVRCHGKALALTLFWRGTRSTGAFYLALLHGCLQPPLWAKLRNHHSGNWGRIITLFSLPLGSHSALALFRANSGFVMLQSANGRPSLHLHGVIESVNSGAEIEASFFFEQSLAPPHFSLHAGALTVALLLLHYPDNLLFPKVVNGRVIPTRYLNKFVFYGCIFHFPGCYVFFVRFLKNITREFYCTSKNAPRYWGSVKQLKLRQRNCWAL